MPRRNPLCFLFPWAPFCRRRRRPHYGRPHDRHDDHEGHDGGPRY